MMQSFKSLAPLGGTLARASQDLHDCATDKRISDNSDHNSKYCIDLVQISSDEPSSVTSLNSPNVVGKRHKLYDENELTG
jgi:hypothetical protein